jgi:hypothetical protein
MTGKFRLTLLGLVLMASLPLAAGADEPGRHPLYAHAFSDLRAARWLVEHRGGDDRLMAQEDMALREIDVAMDIVHHAARFEDKDLGDVPHVSIPDNQGRLHQAMDVLHRAHEDLDHSEDDPRIRGLRDQAVEHEEAAYQILDRAVREDRR